MLCFRNNSSSSTGYTKPQADARFVRKGTFLTSSYDTLTTGDSEKALANDVVHDVIERGSENIWNMNSSNEPFTKGIEYDSNILKISNEYFTSKQLVIPQCFKNSSNEIVQFTKIETIDDDNVNTTLEYIDTGSHTGTIALDNLMGLKTLKTSSTGSIRLSRVDELRDLDLTAGGTLHSLCSIANLKNLIYNIDGKSNMDEVSTVSGSLNSLTINGKMSSSFSLVMDTSFTGVLIILCKCTDADISNLKYIYPNRSSYIGPVVATATEGYENDTYDFATGCKYVIIDDETCYFKIEMDDTSDPFQPKIFPKGYVKFNDGKTRKTIRSNNYSEASFTPSSGRYVNSGSSFNDSIQIVLPNTLTYVYPAMFQNNICFSPANGVDSAYTPIIHLYFPPTISAYGISLSEKVSSNTNSCDVMVQTIFSSAMGPIYDTAGDFYSEFTIDNFQKLIFYGSAVGYPGAMGTRGISNSGSWVIENHSHLTNSEVNNFFGKTVSTGTGMFAAYLAEYTNQQGIFD